MRGTWQTTDSGGPDMGTIGLVLVVVFALAIASDIAAALASFVAAALITFGVLVVLAAAVAVAVVVHRVRHPLARLPQLPRSASLELPRERPRELEAPKQEMHLHFHGMSPEAVAAALRDARIGE